MVAVMAGLLLLRPRWQLRSSSSREAAVPTHTPAQVTGALHAKAGGWPMLLLLLLEAVGTKAAERLLSSSSSSSSAQASRRRASAWSAPLRAPRRLTDGAAPIDRDRPLRCPRQLPPAGPGAGIEAARDAEAAAAGRGWLLPLLPSPPSGWRMRRFIFRGGE